MKPNIQSLQKKAKAELAEGYDSAFYELLQEPEIQGAIKSAYNDYATQWASHWEVAPNQLGFIIDERPSEECLTQRATVEAIKTCLVEALLDAHPVETLEPLNRDMPPASLVT